jgi:hypothetical protein
MATRESPRRAFWLEHLAKAREHGGPLKAYADTNGLSAGALYAAKSANKSRAMMTRTKATGAATLLPVQLGASAPSAPIRIALPNGLRIEVPSTLSVEQWRPLLALLSSGA